MPIDLSDQIEADALTPSSASNDMGSVSKRPLTELIAADKYLAAKEAAVNNPRRGLRYTRLVPPGAT